MRDHTKAAASHQSDPHVDMGNELTGWQPFAGLDHFETHTGPYWYRQEADGSFRSAFRIEKKHLNEAGSVSGGCLMAFADASLFVITRPVLHGPGVTISFACNFIDGAVEGDLIVAAGEITRAGGSLIFVRGQLTSGERTLFTFSGTIKRVKQKT